ncbi:TetR/AcrR family transcriptional regulator [Gallaecimonas sp. GXIMD4217]|uniref:TetR/AcrR family transcriptional regulator n=1 Tax=Gallaecimonas sp. GXIMD4217 TaxID=3131927 RepID=UPI00311AF71E
MPNRGRPAGASDDARQKLLDAAKHCFTRHPYHRVTTRMLADQAGVNAALIRYYFLNKEGLYQEMFKAVTGEVMATIGQAIRQQRLGGFEDFFRAYNTVMKQNPEFPALLFKELALEEGLCRNFLLDYLRQGPLPLFETMISELSRHGTFKPDLALPLLRLSCIALASFPWLARGLLRDLDGIEFTDDLLDKLARHNGELLSSGVFQPEEQRYED